MNKDFWERYLYQTIVIVLLIGLYLRLDAGFQEIREKQNFLQDSVLRFAKPVIMSEDE